MLHKSLKEILANNLNFILTEIDDLAIYRQSAVD